MTDGTVMLQMPWLQKHPDELQRHGQQECYWRYEQNDHIGKICNTTELTYVFCAEAMYTGVTDHVLVDR